MAVTIVRTASSSQIGSLLTQASASTTYLTQTSASTIYATKASPTFTGTATMTYPTINSNTNRNTKMGTSSLASISGGVENVGIGYQSLFSNTSGNYNVGIGSSALLGIQTGSNNIGIGFSSLGNATGSNNIGIGQYAGLSSGSGSYNVIIGSNYGSTISNLSNNIIISDGQGNIRIQADSNGAVAMPSQPRFLAVRSGDQTGYNPSTQVNPIIYNSITYNVGNAYNTSTGKFTAQVSGNYLFEAGTYQSTAVQQLWFVLNGARERSFVLDPANSANVAGTGMIYLNAGDNIGVVSWSGGSTNVTIYTNSYHTFFRGQLIN
jgi:hypothetical protein